MPAREMRMEMFLRALLRRDFDKAKSHLDKLQKLVKEEDEWGRGYLKALNGFMSAIKDNDTDSLIIMLLNNPDEERIKEFLRNFEEIKNQEFRDDYEKGYYTAWVELLQAYLSQARLQLKERKGD
ncbi:hypothetical protein PFDSM3638_06930 [Pyrococcus furiosus DSM 3638]|nr:MULTISPECIES: hypothetical protein [Pyrococcus]AFN04165.1 hypothetical protein PFC_06145 [Pyrococcus furiosus COM1]MDK2868892.1 hypothetical protein [Pyrococcus sp.]QEK79018.1 hypothetical protein PFDSM3638_06930 [Pyrococcus furiosus DSM 3638]